jgi:hypothetical protein
MKIEFTQTREYSGIGLRHAGDVEHVDTAIGKQLIAQGFAVEIKDQKAKTYDKVDLTKE